MADCVRTLHSDTFGASLMDRLSENPEPMLFLEARNTAPVQPTFKPTVTLLARKPKGATDDDSDEERRKKNEAEFEERKARAQKERAEKERRYAEAREKIFGTSTPATSDESRGASPRRGGKGRGRGGRDSQPRSSNEQSPARPTASRQLFEPAYSPKPGSVFVQRKESSLSRPSTPNNQEKPIREPRGPQTTVRGGRGFAPRGGRQGAVP